MWENGSTLPENGTCRQTKPMKISKLPKLPNFTEYPFPKFPERWQHPCHPVLSCLMSVLTITSFIFLGFLLKLIAMVFCGTLTQRNSGAISLRTGIPVRPFLHPARSFVGSLAKPYAISSS